MRSVGDFQKCSRFKQEVWLSHVTHPAPLESSIFVETSRPPPIYWQKTFQNQGVSLDEIMTRPETFHPKSAWEQSVRGLIEGYDNLAEQVRFDTEKVLRDVFEADETWPTAIVERR